MTQKKLEMIGPYTAEHKGPFCTRNGKPVRILCTDRQGSSPIIALVQDGGLEHLVGAFQDGVAITTDRNYDIMNAREVPVAQEFWINEYSDGSVSVFLSEEIAQRFKYGGCEIIHVREVLPGEDE